MISLDSSILVTCVTSLTSILGLWTLLSMLCGITMHPLMLQWQIIVLILSMNILHIIIKFTTSSFTEQNFNSSNTIPNLEQNSSTTAAVAISATVVIVLLAVMIISVIMFYFYFKKKKFKGTDNTRWLWGRCTNIKCTFRNLSLTETWMLLLIWKINIHLVRYHNT